MGDIWQGVVAIGVALLGGGVFIGIAALLRAKRESEKLDAEARKLDAERADVLVDASSEVIRQLREELAAMCIRQEVDRSRIVKLEQAVIAWDDWADRVTALLDRAVGMMTSEHAAGMAPDVDAVKATRPMRRSA